MLPPLIGVRKRIDGARGATLVADSRLAIEFDVVDNELRYRAPFDGFVDVLEEDDAEGFRGRFTFRGRELGRFAMARVETEPASGVAHQLVKHLDEAHAMEQSVLRMLDGLISTTDDPEILQALERHRLETEGHVQRMHRRLEAHGVRPSTVRQLTGVLGALARVPLEWVRGEKADRHARDAYATEHMEIATYELLRRVAQRANDEETVTACAEILAEEQAMAQTIEQSWDKFVDLSLREEGVTV
jgi:ferritin-like metal-binding protein YciE